MRDATRSVRVRLTLVATAITAIAVFGAGAWLSHAVEGSLRSEVDSANATQLNAVVLGLQGGQSPEDAIQAEAVGGGIAGGPVIQICAGDRTLAATPGVGETCAAGPDALPTGVQGASPLSPTFDASAGYAVTTKAVVGPQGSLDVVVASPLASVRQSVDAVRAGLLVTFPLLVAAVGGLTWFLTGRALHPVEAIRTEVEAISGSTLTRRVPVPPSGDEVHRLALTMNAMLDRVEAASLRQQQFVADASHELRSPVAAIRTELEVAQLADDPTAWPATVERLLAQEGRLEAVIADLLLLATLDEGAPLPEAAPVDLVDLVGDEVAGRPGRAGVTVAVEVPIADRSVAVVGSAGQLRRLVGNLVDNAVRHATSSVVVAVTSPAVGDQLGLVVDDDGPGIPADDRERVFERFTRLDDHRARAHAIDGAEGAESAGPAGVGGGAGLGLSLVRAIASRHGGTVVADASPLGGARFTVSLPRAPRPR